MHGLHRPLIGKKMSGRTLQLIMDYLPRIFWAGIKFTIPLTILSFVLGLIIAIFIALVQVSKVKVLKPITSFYVWVFRGTPLMVQLFIIFFGLPKMGITLDPFPAGVIAFSLNVGAYSAETLRFTYRSVGSLYGAWNELLADDAENYPAAGS